MKSKIGLLLPFLLLLGACGSNDSSSSIASSTSVPTTTSEATTSQETTSKQTSEEESSTSKEESSEIYDLEKLAQDYGEFAIDGDAELQSDGVTYLINVGASKKKITVSGYGEYNFVIQNGESLETFKGVTIVFNHACLVGTAGPVIEYKDITSKNVEINTKAETENCLINTGILEDDACVLSSKNLEFNLGENSSLYAVSMGGHVADADDEIRIYGKGSLIAYSGHDAFHSKIFRSNDAEGAPDQKEFEGTLTVSFALSQAIDATSKKGKGEIHLTSGDFLILGAESVFKTDKTLEIAEGVVVSADNISKDAVVEGDNSPGLTITNNGTFNVNGEPYVIPAA